MICFVASVSRNRYMFPPIFWSLFFFFFLIFSSDYWPTIRVLDKSRRRVASQRRSILALRRKESSMRDAGTEFSLSLARPFAYLCFSFCAPLYLPLFVGGAGAIGYVDIGRVISLKAVSGERTRLRLHPPIILGLAGT